MKRKMHKTEDLAQLRRQFQALYRQTSARLILPATLTLRQALEVLTNGQCAD